MLFQVFCWGDNSKKQLGLGYKSKDFIWTVEQNLHFPGVVLQLATGTSAAVCAFLIVVMVCSCIPLTLVLAAVLVPGFSSFREGTRGTKAVASLIFA